MNDKEYLLKKIGCDDIQINNILKSNPYYLEKSNEEVLDLIKCLLDYGFNNLNILFDSNPYILNLEPFEIKKYIDKRKKYESLEDIIDDLDSNPILFNEM